ncbi:homeobox protein YOX1 [Staphylotrichum tortipilum]|uniref:Homeobox protein YOX1 n=1 Tax=Staphylotrichum tortipilum TaxID=2831512 RepID=A0AAN6MT00_9PEZI|nr:homeobox protein YOX1 [Staphylotrichum longicolle]
MDSSQPQSSPSSSPLPTASPSSDTTDGRQSLGIASQQSQSSSPPKPDSTSPSVEPPRHPKGKRNRTEKGDKAILEAAYQKNSKPDKAERLELLKRVNLPTEKAVQIWFQNRRQNDRRKSRPWSPQVVEAVTQGRVRIVSDGLIPGNTSFNLENALVSVPSASQEQPAGSSPSPHSTLEFGSSQDTARTEGPVAWQGEHAAVDETAAPPAAERRVESQQVLSRSFEGPTGYLSNRWNAAGSAAPAPNPGYHGFFRPDPHTRPGAFLPRPLSTPPQYHLSTSLEGKAEVIQAIPSPPRSTAPPPITDILLPRPESPGPPDIYRRRGQRVHRTHSLEMSNRLPPILTRGRSSNPQEWEYAVSGNREDALTVQAKHENSGSATAAINLLKFFEQSSSRAKRNAPAGGAAPRYGAAKKPKLVRSYSTLARLENTMGPSNRHNMQANNRPAPSDKHKPSRPAGTTFISGNDSDKENWSPDEDGNPRPSRRVAAPSPGITSGSSLTSTGRRLLPSEPPLSKPGRNPRRTLGGSGAPFLSPAGRASTAPSYSLFGGEQRFKRGRLSVASSLEIFEDEEEEGEGEEEEEGGESSEEVRRFMGAGASPSKEKAVEGLLRLSQGNWER